MSKRTPAQTGRWLPLTTIRRDGLAAANDGALLRVVRLEALAPLRMSVEQLEQTSRAVGELAAHLPDRQSLQLITDAQPLDCEQLVDELQHHADHARSALAHEGLGDRGVALERLALATADGVLEHAHRRVGMQLEHLLVIPWRPSRGTVRPGTITAPALARAVDELDAQVASIVAHLQALDLTPEILDGRHLLALLDRHLNPGAEPLAHNDATGLLGELPVDRDRALEAAGRLRGALCRSEVTERRGHLDAGATCVLCRTVSSVPDHTWLGWLLHLMRSPYPFTLSVHWQAGRRATERQRARQRYRRIWGVQRGREMRLKAPDPEAGEREREAAELNQELTATAGAGVYQVAITIALEHPDGNAVELERHARELERDLLARTDARLHHPIFAQLPAWRSTWPLAQDPLAIRRKYVTANLADTTPLVAARCGSPSGIPLGWARPGRTLERLDPFDPAHENHLMVIAGKSGGGKTMCTNLILARILAQGAAGGVIDRAGHYEFLASLIPGAIAVNLGTRTGQAINPWDVDDQDGELAPEKLEYLLALHSFFLGRPLPDGTYDLEPRDHSQLSLAIRAVYRRCRLTGELPRETLLQEELYRRCEEARADGNVELAAQLAQLAEGLHDYVGDGAGSYLADRPTSVPVDSPLVIFDTRDVGDARAGAAMFTIVEHLARRSARTRLEHAHRGPWGGRTFLVVDEGWKMLERRSTGRWINEQARRSRHNRLFLIAISQSVQDFLRHPEGEALVSQSSIQLLLRQLDGQTPAVQQALGLTDEEAHTISCLRTVKGEHAEAFLCNGRRGRGLIEIHAGAAEYWIATSEPDHDQPLRAQVLAEEGGDPWAAVEQLAAHHQPRSAR
jgi:TraG P-loop domain